MRNALDNRVGGGAVAAMAFALDEDVRANAPEALYEAYQALDQDDTRLNAIIAQS